MSAFAKVVLGLTQNPVVTRTMTGTAPGKALARRFVAGNTLDEAVAASRTLNAQGMRVSLDLLGEEVHDADTARSATEGYVEAIRRIAATGLDANVSVKLTQLGLSFDNGLARSALERLSSAAGLGRTTVTVDMEDSRFTEATVDLYAAVQSHNGNLGICLQAYLHRSPEDLDRLIPLGGHIRLCKGAYVESSAIAFQASDDVNAAFARLLERLMAAEEVVPAIATHDDQLIDLARLHARTRSRGWEFQMLFGVRPKLQRELQAEGHDLRIYVPYGSQWYAYLTRRLAERPANAIFFIRALAGRR